MKRALLATLAASLLAAVFFLDAFGAGPIRIGLVAPTEGPAAAAGAEFLEGARDAVAGTTLGKQPVEIVPIEDPGDASVRSFSSRVKRAKVEALCGFPTPQGSTTLVSAARSLRMPLILAVPWEPTYTLDTRDTLCHLSYGYVDHVTAAGTYAVIPMDATKVAVIHDDSEPCVALTAAFERNLPVRLEDGGVHPIPEEAEAVAALAAALGKDGVDVVFVAAGPAAAMRVTKGFGKEAPALLFAEGLATPELATTAPESARFLEGTSPYLERRGVREYREERGREGKLPSPLAQRGFAALRLMLEGIEGSGGSRKRTAGAIRSIPEPALTEAPLFVEWGQLRDFDYYLCQRGEGGAKRIEPAYLPNVDNGLLFRHRTTSHYRIDPDSQMVLVTWGEEDGRGPDLLTIEEDLKELGLTSSGYEAEMDEWVKDDLLARAMARMHKLFWRNADGTAIPGVSFDITFGTELPDKAKAHKVIKVTIAGDDPGAGGRAFPPNRAYTFSTFLRRTMYQKHALRPPLGHDDLRFFNGKYAWGSKLEDNLRMEAIRALIDGYAGAMGLTSAHEIGHLCGCGHDTESPRSLMNVASGAGLDPVAAEWIPSHRKMVEKRLGHVDPGS